MAISAQHTKFVYPDYVSPLPAEDLIKVALNKQQQFDQNVAKVQSQLDAYGQLKNNIYHEGEKAYFDETMTKLVTAVNNSAGIDFSKTANVQSVLNIGKPLEKDSIIINSIQNGKEIQRRQKTLSELDQSKRSASNDWFYMQDANNYLRSSELGTSIAKNKAYEEYTDISEIVVDLVKNFSKEEQNEFFSQGKGSLQGYLEKVSVQGFNTTKLAEKIKGILATDPKAAKQLEIDTQFAYNNLGVQRAHQMYVEDQTLKAATLDDAVNKTKEELDYYTRQNAAVKSPAVQKEINKLTQDLQTLTQYRNVALQESAKPVDQFNPQDFYQVYQNKFITNLANTYSSQKISRDLKDDKVWDIVQKRNMESYKIGLDIQKEKTLSKINKYEDYSRSLKERVVDVPYAKVFIQNISNPQVRAAIGSLIDRAKTNKYSSSAQNLNSFINSIEIAYTKKGISQIKQLEKALEYLDGSSNRLTDDIKQDILAVFGVTDNPTSAGFKELISKIKSELKDISTTFDATKLTTSGDKVDQLKLNTPISFNNAFDYTLNSFNDINFLKNSDVLGDQFAIGVLEQSLDYTGSPKYSVKPEPPKSQKIK